MANMRTADVTTPHSELSMMSKCIVDGKTERKVSKIKVLGFSTA